MLNDHNLQFTRVSHEVRPRKLLRPQLKEVGLTSISLVKTNTSVLKLFYAFINIQDSMQLFAAIVGTNQLN